jgi:predicted nucleic acid-binding protein
MLASDPARRDAWKAHALSVAQALRVLPYTAATAVRHGELLATTRATGAPRGPLDLVIAAHAAESGRVIVTRDAAARFGDLPGVRAVTLA